MNDAAEASAAEIFAELRPRLIRLAYRMLGSVACTTPGCAGSRLFSA